MNDKVYKWNRIPIEKEQLKKFSERSFSKELITSLGKFVSVQIVWKDISHCESSAPLNP